MKRSDRGTIPPCVVAMPVMLRFTMAPLPMVTVVPPGPLKVLGAARVLQREALLSNELLPMWQLWIPLLPLTSLFYPLT
ncbi:MAG: hypothetical protein AB2L14_25935 [Candidatus Xenobiia bacterium LiM19]